MSIFMHGRALSQSSEEQEETEKQGSPVIDNSQLLYIALNKRSFNHFQRSVLVSGVCRCIRSPPNSDNV